MLAESKELLRSLAQADGLDGTRQGNGQRAAWRAVAFGREIYSFATPGHTLGHVCYFSALLILRRHAVFWRLAGRLFEAHIHRCIGHL